MWHANRAVAAAALLFGTSLGGCHGNPGSNTPPDGTLTVRIKPATPMVSGLQLTAAHAQIDGLTVLGDVAPDGRSMVSEFQLDFLSTGASFTLSMLPQGLYSRVRFSADETRVDGSWRGMPLHFAIGDDSGSAAVDLRSNGVDVTPGHDGELVVAVDAGSWFAGNVLDGATPDATGALVVDGAHNASVAATVAARIPASFTLQDATSVQ